MFAAVRPFDGLRVTKQERLASDHVTLISSGRRVFPVIRIEDPGLRVGDTVSPLGFGQSELSRTKTDKADAALIARYCLAMRPRLWEPPSPSQRRLQRLGPLPA